MNFEDIIKMSDEEILSNISDTKIKELAKANQFAQKDALAKFNKILCVACGNVLRTKREFILGFHLTENCYNKIKVD